MKLQRQLSNGTSWVDDERTEYFFDMVLAREVWFAPRQKRQPMTTYQEITELLEAGETIHYDNDWYANLRCGDAHQRKIEVRQAKQKPIETVLADCGHVVDRVLVMSASLGTSCPDCYDEMSN